MKGDRRGVLSLPIKLAVSFLIIGMAVPPVMDMMEDLETEKDGMELEKTCDILVSALERAYYAGTGNVSSMRLSVPFGDSLAIGGGGYEGYTVRMMHDGERTGIRYLDNPVFRVAGEEIVLTGECYLNLTCTVEGDGDGRSLAVKVERYDRVHPVTGDVMRMRTGDDAGRDRVPGICRGGQGSGRGPRTGRRDSAHAR